MSATETSNKQTKILGLLRAPVTAELSVLFMQKIVSISMSNIAYARHLCSDDSFTERDVHGNKIKILRDNVCENGYKIITWLKGAFEALHKQYLRMIIFAVHTESLDTPALESYSYEFIYHNEDDVECTVRSSASDFEGLSSKYASKRNIYNPEEIEKMVKKLLESCQKLQMLKPLPEEKLLTMKLLYYDNVTPRDYEPGGFIAANSSIVTYACEKSPKKYRLGFITTPFHATKVRFQSALVDDVQNVTTEEASMLQEEGVRDIVDDIIPATPEHQHTATLKSPILTKVVEPTTSSTSSFRDNGHEVAAQVDTDQPTQGHWSTSSECSHQFAMPHPSTMQHEANVHTHDENTSSKVVDKAHAQTIAKKKPRAQPRVKTQGFENDDPPKKKKAVTKMSKKVVNKNAKARHAKKFEENKENTDVMMTTPAIDDSDCAGIQQKFHANAGVSGTMTPMEVTSQEMHGSDQRDLLYDAGSDVGSVAASSPVFLRPPKKDKHMKPAKSSVPSAAINIMDVSSASSVDSPKEVNCCCTMSHEFGLMIRCEICMTWQHSVCYGIMDDLPEPIEHHCCVQCATTNTSLQCTDRRLFQAKEENRKTLCIFRRALQLCCQLHTITKAIIRREIEVLTDYDVDKLISHMLADNVIRGSGPRSTVFTVNSKKVIEWLPRLSCRR